MIDIYLYKEIYIYIYTLLINVHWYHKKLLFHIINTGVNK